MRRKIFFTLFAALFFIGLIFLFQNQVRNSFYLICRPFLNFFFELGKKGMFLTNLFQLQKENETLKIENLKLKSEIAKLEELKKENELLKQALNLKEEKLEILPAKILAKEIDQEAIVINRGKKDGVFEGEVVILPQGNLLGRVKKVHQNFSFVELISRKDFKFNAKIAGQEIEGIVEGKGNLNLLLTFIPKEAKLKEGDLVVTSALGGLFPPSILVGEIVSIENLDVKPYQEAKISFEFPLAQGEVFLITNFNPWQKD